MSLISRKESLLKLSLGKYGDNPNLTVFVTFNVCDKIFWKIKISIQIYLCTSFNYIFSLIDYPAITVLYKKVIYLKI